QAAADRLPLQPGAGVAHAPARVEHRSRARRQRRASRRVELRPRGARDPGQARDALVGRAHDASAPAGRGRAEDVPQEGCARERGGATAESGVLDLNRGLVSLNSKPIWPAPREPDGRPLNGMTGATDQRGAVRGSGNERKLRHSIGGSSTGRSFSIRARSVWISSAGSASGACTTVGSSSIAGVTNTGAPAYSARVIASLGRASISWALPPIFRVRVA